MLSCAHTATNTPITTWVDQFTSSIPTWIRVTGIVLNKIREYFFASV